MDFTAKIVLILVILSVSCEVRVDFSCEICTESAVFRCLNCVFSEVFGVCLLHVGVVLGRWAGIGNAVLGIGY